MSDSATPWIAACQASLSITNSRNLLKLMPIESGMPSSHLILCRPLLLLPTIPPSIRVFSNESTLRMRWPKYWSLSFGISSSNEHPGLIATKGERKSRLKLKAMGWMAKRRGLRQDPAVPEVWLVERWEGPGYMCKGKTIFLLLIMLLTPNVWIFSHQAVSRHQFSVWGFHSILTLYTRSWHWPHELRAQPRKTSPLYLRCQLQVQASYIF